MINTNRSPRFTLGSILLPLILGLSSVTSLSFAADLRVINETNSPPMTRPSYPLKVQSLPANLAADTMETYIILGVQPSIASYRGGIDGYESTMREGETKLDVHGAAAQAYRHYLKETQSSLITTIEQVLGREVTVVQTLQTAVNAIVIELKSSEVKSITSLAGIESVQKDSQQTIKGMSSESRAYALPAIPARFYGEPYAAGMLDYIVSDTLDGINNIKQEVAGLSLNPSRSVVTPQADTQRWLGGFAWILAPHVWQGTNNMPGTMGEGVVVGVIDTGIDPFSPSFAAQGDDGYIVKNPRGSYSGVCNPQASVYDPTFPCNSKLIGAWGYPQIENGSPIDGYGHGSHTASTAAGNIVNHATVKTKSGLRIEKNIAGVAPHANIISYRACDSQNQCPISAFLFAADRAIQDGVDVINFSAGYTAFIDPWVEPVSKAFLAAEDAGIFVSAAAGNSGPREQTINSTSGTPWITTTGNTSHNLVYQNSLTDFSGGDAALRPELISGQILSQGYGPAKIVDAADYNNPFCEKDKFSAKFTGEIVVCQYEASVYKNLEKNTVDNGAGALILMLPQFSDGVLMGPGFLWPVESDQPSTEVTYNDGEQLRQWLHSGKDHMAALTGTQVVVDDTQADIMTFDSSRGPQQTNPSLLKPDIVAPGKGIFAAFNANRGYAIENGTSMAAPHITGAAALIKALHPKWTPMQVKSAIMTTAYTGVVKEDGLSPATPFDMGAGRVDLDKATRASLVLDETAQHFMEADPNQGGDPASLNLPSLAQGTCVVNCTWHRTVTNGRDMTTTWVAMPNSDVTIEPAAFSLNAGETQTLTFTANVSDVPVGNWLFSQVGFKSLTDGVPDVNLPLAALSAVSNLNHIQGVEITTTQATDQATLNGLRAVEISQAQVHVFGPTKAIVNNGILPTSPDYLDSNTRYSYFTFKVPEGAERLIAEITKTDAKDLDLYVGTGETVDIPNAYYYATHLLRPLEHINIQLPSKADVIWIAVQNYRDMDPQQVNFQLQTAFLSPATQDLTVTVPSYVPAGQAFSADIAFNLPDSQSGDHYYGAFYLGTDSDHPDNLGTTYIDLIRH